MIEDIYRRTRGMAQMSQRLFAQVREPDPGVAWNDVIRDPFVALEDELAAIVDGPIPIARQDPGEVQAIEGRMRDIQSPRFGRRTVSPPPLLKPQPAAEAPRPASVHFRPPSESVIAGIESIPFQRGAHVPLAQDLSAASQITTAQEKLRAAKHLTGGGRAFKSSRSSVVPQFAFGERQQETSTGPDPGSGSSRAHREIHPRVDDRPSAARHISPADPEGSDRFMRQNPAGAATESALRHVERTDSRLVQTTSLVQLLKKNTSSTMAPQAHLSAPVLPEDVAPQTPVNPSEDSTRRAGIVEEVLEELEDRLRFEFLRTYGSSGE